jgi:mannose-binding lectin 1
MTWSLQDTLTGGGQDAIPNAEQEKFEQEFQNYQKQLDQKKEDYIKEHPDAAPSKKDDDDWFEEEQIRELRQIFQGQSETRLLIQSLSRKLDEIVGRQETTLSLVNNIQLQQGGGQALGTGGGAPPPAAPGTPGIQRNEVETILAASRELIGSTREIKNYLTAITAKLDQNPMQHGGAPPPPAGFGVGSVDYTHNFNELKETMSMLKRDLSVVSQRVHSQPVGVAGQQIECPTANCLSSTLFFGVAVFQVVALIGYAVYKSSKESSAKKFY